VSASERASWQREGPSATPGLVFLSSEGGDVSAVRVASALLQHRGVIVGVMSGCVLAALAVGLLLPRTYTAVSSFIPQSRRASTSLLGIAEQFGLSVPVGDRWGEPGLLRGVSQVRRSSALQWTAAIRSRPIPALSVARLMEITEHEEDGAFEAR